MFDFCKLKMDDKDTVKRYLERITASSDSKANSDAASKALGVAAATGVETNATVLVDIRNLMQKTLEATLRVEELMVQKEKGDERRHNELAAILVSMSDMRVSTPAPAPQVAVTQLGTRDKAGSYYYSSSRLVNGVGLLACILMHLDSAVGSSEVGRLLETSDSTFMDVKAWTTMCSVLMNGAKNDRIGLRVPKPSDEDFKAAASIVASTLSGRTVKCGPEGVVGLLSSCPAIMVTVEWLRSTTIKCRGLVAPQREAKLSCISHPFVTREGSFNITEVQIKEPTSQDHHHRVSKLKIDKKKEYVKLVVEQRLTCEEALKVITK